MKSITKDRKGKLEISVADDLVSVRDFGNFKSPYYIKVDRKFWTKYCNTRRDYEILHAKLLKKKIYKLNSKYEK